MTYQTASNLHVQCSLFADDCLLYRKIETDSDHRALQEDLYNVEMWAQKWLMTFNLESYRYH